MDLLHEGPQGNEGTKSRRREHRVAWDGHQRKGRAATPITCEAQRPTQGTPPRARGPTEELGCGLPITLTSISTDVTRVRSLPSVPVLTFERRVVGGALGDPRNLKASPIHLCCTSQRSRLTRWLNTEDALVGRRLDLIGDTPSPHTPEVESQSVPP